MLDFLPWWRDKAAAAGRGSALRADRTVDPAASDSSGAGWAALEAILFVFDTGCRWRDLPEQLGCGSGHTAWRRLREWQDAGVWDRLHQLVLDELSEAQLLDWSRACIDGVSVRSKGG